MNKITTVFLCVFIVLFSFFYNYIAFNHKFSHSNAGLNTTELITKFGYLQELHEITTKDGYVLTLHRIPNANSPTTTKLPILLLPGMFLSATEFISLGPGRALGLLLADRDYDVWLGNFRGTTWSRKHNSFDPDKDQQYWNYTLHELGVFDVPAMIDCILDKTSQNQLHYIGFSQANTVAYITLSEFPDYNKKIKLLSAIAPSTFLHDSNSPIVRIMFELTTITESLLYYPGPVEISPLNGWGSKILQHVCDKNSAFFSICRLSFYTFQYGLGDISHDFLPVVVSNMPSGTSSYILLHNMQLTGFGELVRFNWGKRENLRLYGQEYPLAYNTSLISAPTAIYYSRHDNLINYKKNIKKVVKLFSRHVIKLEWRSALNFNHLDFILGSNNLPLYQSIIETIELN